MKQSEALEILKMGHNVLLTGPAGSGKTFLLNKYIKYLEENNVKIGITASTGIAATHLDGVTIHSWCNIGIKDALTGKEIEKIIGKNYINSRIRYTTTLIIDEISMLNANRLDLVNTICQAIRQDVRPFGGLQIILCGDFFQLPPIAKDREDSRFVTESNIWKKMNIKICYLDEQYRQGEDKKFLSVLNSIRDNNVTEEIKKVLQKRVSKPIKKKIKPTKLYTLNIDVDAINFSELNKLSGEERSYEMSHDGIPHLVDGLKKNCLAYETLRLKKEAVVMFVKNNFEKGYVNGTLGKVVDFDDDNGNPIVETLNGDRIVAGQEGWSVEEDGDVLASVYQIPLRLAWAITIHKSQGMSLDCAEIDLSKTFEYGMGYVALSRVRSLDGIKLMGINDMAFQVHEKAIELDKVLRKKTEDDLNDYNNTDKQEIKRLQQKFIDDNKVEKGSDMVSFLSSLPF